MGQYRLTVKLHTVVVTFCQMCAKPWKGPQGIMHRLRSVTPLRFSYCWTPPPHPPLPKCLPLQSPADQCKKIHAGDEVIQVNHQTVVSDQASKHSSVLPISHSKHSSRVYTANHLSFSILCPLAPRCFLSSAAMWAN